MKTISTYISPSVYLLMKETADAEGIKSWRFIEEGIRLRIQEYEGRRRKQAMPQLDESHDETISQAK